MPSFIDLTGKKFGSLTVLNRVDASREVKWFCLCDCGKATVSRGYSLRSGKAGSCGCVRIKRLGDRSRRHGGSNSYTYRSWQMARHRCHNPNNVAYPDYGGRGIEMCPEWRESFLQFLADMGPRPEGKTLDRIDPNKGYAPDNCRWATWVEQSTTRRDSRLIPWSGELMTTAAIARVNGISSSTLYGLIARGLSVVDAVSHAKAHLRPRRHRYIST